MGKHSLQRIKERYNLNLTYTDEYNIIGLLKQGRCIFLEEKGKEFNQRFAYVEYRNLPLKVLYARMKNGAIQLITTYPLDVDEFNEVKQKEFESSIQKCMSFLKTNGYVIYKKHQHITNAKRAKNVNNKK